MRWSVLLGESFRSRCSSLYRMRDPSSISEGEEMSQDAIAAHGAGIDAERLRRTKSGRERGSLYSSVGESPVGQGAKASVKSHRERNQGRSQQEVSEGEEAVGRKIPGSSSIVRVCGCLIRKNTYMSSIVVPCSVESGNGKGSISALRGKESRSLQVRKETRTGKSALH